MSIQLPLAFPAIAVLAAGLYIYNLREPQKKGDFRAAYLFVFIWTAWTVACTFWVAQLYPRPSSIPPISPSPSFMFLMYLQFVVYPDFIVLFLVIFDVILFSLRTRPSDKSASPSDTPKHYDEGRTSTS